MMKSFHPTNLTHNTRFVLDAGAVNPDRHVSGCGDCWCIVTNSTASCPSWQPPNYSAATVAAFNAFKQTSPVQELDNNCNPYVNTRQVIITVRF